MSGLDQHMLACIRALAENRIQDAKKYAVNCCIHDNTKKNESAVNRYQKLLTSGPNKIEVPANIKGTLQMEDMSNFCVERYYLGKQQKKLFEQIKKGIAVTMQLREYHIPYSNSSIIYGVPGTGKTEFAKYVAYKLGIPYAYINFSLLIDSHMGDTSKNIKRIFDFCKGQKSVLLLDEIDCIGLKRGSGGNGGCDGELARTTISLMQALDELTDGQIVLAATNRFDLLDPALVRRFQRSQEFCPFEEEERIQMMKTFMNGVNPDFITENVLTYAKDVHTQAELTKYMVDVIIDHVSTEADIETAVNAYKEEYKMEKEENSIGDSYKNFKIL